MRRRAFFGAALQVVHTSSSFLAVGTGVFSLLAKGQQAFALGGTLPQLHGTAPDFKLTGVKPSRTGFISTPEVTELQLGDFSGQWLVLYFYPRDFTEGCTIEARGFQQDLGLFHAAGAEVVGISADNPDSHAQFCGSEGLSYPLLSDPGGVVSRSYGSWIAPFSQRHTFVIDPNGILRASFVAVHPSGHSQEVFSTLRSLQGE
jgi:peroxiredoxin Q/BCP